MSKVQILLSTYNGEKYLEEQLDSILNQDYPDITILIRDDGSTDKTIEILDQYSRKYNQIKYYKGNNIGVINSFFDLMKNADITAEYYSLSDQDDVWLSDKISRAVNQLNLLPSNKPLLYCGRTTLVDEYLNPLRNSIKLIPQKPSFGNALIENICTGCTSVFNKELLLLVCNHIPQYTVMHDWWLYLTASAYGEVYYDENSYILYRQHQANVIGSKSNYIAEFLMRLKRFKGKQGNISRQVIEFDRLFVNNYFDKKNLLNYIKKYRKNSRIRLHILFSNKIYRHRFMDNLIFKFLFLIGSV